MTRQWPKRINRLDALLNYGKPLILVISGLPGIGSTSLSTWLAGSAVLGALAFVFQGLLRDFVAGLVVLLEDVGVLVTSLRCLDQRVVVIPNSRCDRLVNHTRIRSGVEVLIPLPPANPQLNKSMELVNQEVQAFAADPEWQALLLAQPDVRGVKRVTPMAVELSVVLITHVGDQWAAERALLGRIVQRLEREGVPLAQVQAMTAG